MNGTNQTQSLGKSELRYYFIRLTIYQNQSIWNRHHTCILFSCSTAVIHAWAHVRFRSLVTCIVINGRPSLTKNPLNSSHLPKLSIILTSWFCCGFQCIWNQTYFSCSFHCSQIYRYILWIMMNSNSLFKV